MGGIAGCYIMGATSGEPAQKESLGAALQDIHEALCKLIEEFCHRPWRWKEFSALNLRTALPFGGSARGGLLAAARIM